MNNSKKVITLILVVTIIQLSLSVFSNQFIDYYPYFKNVNLLSDILVKEKSNKGSHKKKHYGTTNAIGDLPMNDFDAYEKKGTLVRFNADTLSPALQKFNEKLIA